MVKRRTFVALLLAISLAFSICVKAEENVQSESTEKMSPEDQLKKDKLMACLNLSRARVVKDEFFVDEVIDIMIIRTGGEKKEKTDKLISMMLLTCYKRINEPQTAKLLAQTDEEIDYKTEENKALLQLEKWKDMYERNDSKALARELGLINDAMKEINKDEESKKEFQKEEADFDDFDKSNKKKSFGLFGINFEEMSHNTKNLIGFFFLGLIVILVSYALKTLTAKKEKKEKPKKKKN